MSIDISQFIQLFFEEASENIEDMEKLLLAIDIKSPDNEDLNAIFRAAHSIKGSAGTFGFHDMTQVTHELETVLDKLRKYELSLTSIMVDVFLESADVLKEQLSSYQKDQIISPDRVDELCTKIKALNNGSGIDDLAPGNSPPEDGIAADQTNTVVDIRFTSELEESRLAPLFDELSDLGTLTIINPLPHCHVELDTDADIEEIRNNCLYLIDESSLNIQPKVKHDVVSDKTHAHDDPSKQKKDLLEAEKSQAKASSNLSNKFSSADSTIRVNTEKVDLLINQVGELVITQAMLAESVSNIDTQVLERLSHSMAQLERNTRDLQESVMSIRMIPVSFVFGRFPRVVRDLANKLNKKIQLSILGESTELDKVLIEKLADPLTHLIRNSLDHGIEAPEIRASLGKPEQGTITLKAYHQGSHVIVQVSDDGAGLNHEKIISTARDRGLDIPDSASDKDVYSLIFSAGFSTANEVTDVSGRGVGMDVVMKNIKDMGGAIDISSTLNKGSTISIKLPLTLAIIDGMLVSVDDQTFIIPLTYISESLQPKENNLKTITNSGQLIKIREEYIRLVNLYDIFSIDHAIKDPKQGILVLLEADNKRIALLVDDLVGQQQVVLKSLESNYKKIDYISGATIMGNGEIALILDINAIMNYQSYYPNLKVCS